MIDRAAFIRAILDAPDDDAPRCIFADWLDEHGEPELAEFIRVQIELSKYPQTGLDRNAPVGLFGERERRFIKWGKSRKRLHKRGRELLEAPTVGEDGRNYYSAAYVWAGIAVRNCHEWLHGSNPPTFRRGFVESIACTAADCLTHLDSILAEHPVRNVKLTTWPQHCGDGLRGDPLDMHYDSETINDAFEMGDNLVMNLLRCRFPGIKFELPRLSTGQRFMEAARADIASVTDIPVGMAHAT